MIFATLGTHHQPFNRFIDGLALLEDDLVVQYGHNDPPADARDAFAFLEFDEMNDYMLEADAVITHGGVGSILCARNAGHVPIVVPRLHHLGEHVDDHQVQLVRALAADKHITPIWDIDDLPRGVSESGRAPAAAKKDNRLQTAVRAAL